jgi:hypothetical protein
MNRDGNPMSLYILRHPASDVSPALYSPDNGDLSVRIIESCGDSRVSPETASFNYVGQGDGGPGTYRQLLELVLTEKNVLTL